MKLNARPIRVFMSYRRASNPHFDGRFYDKLVERFGEDHVFRDLFAIPYGANFESVIADALEQADVVVVVMGPRWAEGLESPDDYVRFEIAEAMRLQKPIVPVLIEDTAMPDAERLPEGIRSLAGINAARVGADPHFARDTQQVIESLQALVRVKPRSRIALVGGAIALGLGGIVLAFLLSRGGPDPGSNHTPVGDGTAPTVIETPASASPSPTVNATPSDIATATVPTQSVPDAPMPDDLSASPIFESPPTPVPELPAGADFAEVRAVDWSIGGYMATGGTDGAVRIWGNDGSFQVALPHDGQIRSVSWSPDGLKLAVADQEQLGVWDFVIGLYLTYQPSPNQWDLVWSDDGTQLASGAHNLVSVWDTSTRERIFEATDEFGLAAAVDLSNDGRLLAAVSNGDVLEWDISSDAEPRTVLTVDEDMSASSVEYRPDGQILLGSARPEVAFVDAATGETIRSIAEEWHSALILISPDGTMMASAGQVSEIRLRDTATGELLASLNADGRPVASMAWSPDGTRLLSGAVDGKAHVWDLADLAAISNTELRASG